MATIGQLKAENKKLTAEIDFMNALRAALKPLGDELNSLSHNFSAADESLCKNYVVDGKPVDKGKSGTMAAETSKHADDVENLINQIVLYINLFSKKIEENEREIAHLEWLEYLASLDDDDD